MLKKISLKLKAKDLMSEPVKVVDPGLGFRKAQDEARELGLKGFAWEKETGLWQAVTAERLEAASQAGEFTLAEISLPAPVITPEASIEEVKAAWKEAGTGLALVQAGGSPLGLVTAVNAAAYLWSALRQMESQMETVMDTVHEAVTMIDKQDLVVGWNRRAEEMYKIPAPDIIGQKIDQFFSSLVVTDVMNKREVRDAYHQPRRGTHVLINASPIRFGEGILGSVASERDITETVYLHNELSKASSQVLLLEQEISKINNHKDGFGKIYGHSRKLSEIINLARRVANTDAAVLIRGESGTGKELFAEAIHLESRRRDRPFVVINCGAIPHNLFESELFGYQPGAFTGADKKGKLGKFEMAHQGTIFLDEIGELQQDLQVKLLRVLQNKKYYRVGGNEPIHVDARVIAATNRDLEKMITGGAFREDLYYRINVVSLEIPPLRERKDDIPELLYLFTREFCHQHNRDLVQIEPRVMNILLNYPWPGNIRELRNMVERMVVLAEENIISEESLPEGLKQDKYRTEDKPASNLAELTERTERQLILETLEKAGGNKSKAAKLLGIPRSTLYYKIRILNIS